ncbi:MmgE/PrpD family protein [Halobaculum magnesiiphilum]|uniref:MmgE/PrpD family protein n=1 Tax=Halobaculum magnesiiphilum TaxID=1017351 RepID=A0A8T8WIW4_9EURY|nr:MmgE/PrpD family protein [Halobaculum magnesiiphilum]QZP39781.1 MmgE/PrpD family protein [Halobaculum magnesiiphilum]
MSKTPERRLATFVADTEYADLPEEVPETVTRAVVDTVGVTLAGAVEGAGETTGRSAGIDPEAADAATLLGTAGGDDPAATALRVGTAAHALDYDDLSWALDGHPSVTLVPPLFALAEETGASGRDLIAAFAVGFEVECAIAGPISPAHYEAGWHATSTFGAFGATAAAASLLDLDADATERALSITASTPAGTKRNFGSMTKPLHAGLCCRSGVTAATLARDGLTATTTAISGDKGFWDLYDPRPDADASEHDGHDEFAFDPDGDWAIESEGIHAKAYPCCYFTHTSIAATADIVDGGVAPDDIDRIEVRAAGGAGDALAYPDPETGLEAKFSMEHAVACAAVRERVDLAAFEPEALGDPAVDAVRERVDFAVDDSLPYDSHAATVVVETVDGERHERRRTNPPGVHTDPLSPDRRRGKFLECAGRAVADEDAERLYERLCELPKLDDVAATVAGADTPSRLP